MVQLLKDRDNLFLKKNSQKEVIPDNDDWLFSMIYEVWCDADLKGPLIKSWSEGRWFDNPFGQDDLFVIRGEMVWQSVWAGWFIHDQRGDGLTIRLGRMIYSWSEGRWFDNPFGQDDLFVIREEMVWQSVWAGWLIRDVIIRLIRIGAVDLHSFFADPDPVVVWLRIRVREVKWMRIRIQLNKFCKN